jgi:hypothetical protein
MPVVTYYLQVVPQDNRNGPWWSEARRLRVRRVTLPQWSELHVLVLRKLGKANYADPGTYCPIALTKGFPHLWYACKTMQCVAKVELAGILPKNQYGA